MTLVFMIALLPLVGSTAPLSDAEIVQSVPEFTDIGSPDLAHAKETWIQMIQNSKQTIDIAQMYVANLPGEAIDPVIDALKAAADRGVKIRLLLSKNMIDNDKPTLERLKRIPNLKVAVINLSPHTGGILHAKYWIVDGRESFVGSQNFDWRALNQIHEMGIHMRSAKIAAGLKRIFDIDWKIAETGRLPSAAELTDRTPVDTRSDIQLVASPASLTPTGTGYSLAALVDLIQKSRKTIRIQVMDYSTKPSSRETTGDWLVIDNALRAAAARGVKVQLLVSHWNTEKPEIDSIKELSLVRNIELKICTLPEHPTRGFIPYARVTHSKYATFDDQVSWIGTSNWTRGYFEATRGVEIILKRPDSAKQLNDVFQKLWNESYSEPVDVNREYPAPRKG